MMRQCVLDSLVRTAARSVSLWTTSTTLASDVWESSSAGLHDENLSSLVSRFV